MKRNRSVRVLTLLLFIIPAFSAVTAQERDSPCCQFLNTISNIKVFESRFFDSIISDRLVNYKISVDPAEDFPYVTFLSKNETESLKLYSSPGNWYGQFFEVSYVSKVKGCRNLLGKVPFEEFYTNDSIRLGMSLTEIWSRISLNNFRTFTHKEVLYFVHEEGIYLDVDPRSPKSVVYFKFANEKLITYGFGFGFPYFNPVFPKRK